ncbi:MAG: hypothetical protein K2R93_13820 [Gemmatimonadaceae bacterium]|nr:hypothetical protein [Gemmatimonadaceae bacterium]
MHRDERPLVTAQKRVRSRARDSLPSLLPRIDCVGREALQGFLPDDANALNMRGINLLERDIVEKLDIARRHACEDRMWLKLHRPARRAGRR